MKKIALALLIALPGLRAAHAQAHVTGVQVKLGWVAPVSSADPVAGYNAYRAPAGSTSFQQMNAALIAVTSYADATAKWATAYDYIVESVDAAGVTSVPSNTATVPLPAPPATMPAPSLSVRP